MSKTSIVCYFLGISLLVISLAYFRHITSASRVSFDIAEYSIGNENQDSPTALSIPSINLDLPVYTSELVDNKWEVSTGGVSYLSGSALPGDTGNTIMYGHNFPWILGKLSKVSVGDAIYIYSGDYMLRYTIKYIQSVDPSQTSILDQSDDKRLTLYTCAGLFDSKRLVVTALLHNSI